MRAALDRLISWTGILLALILLVAGGLLTWASMFIGDQVDQQLSDQEIVMPTEEAIDADEALTDEDRDALREFAGEPLDNGPKAKAYADNYILRHMEAATGGETYNSLGAVQREACADPESEECAQVNAQRDTAFKGNTLRGLLLYGYAFATMGTIAGYAAIGAFVGAVLLLILAGLGMRHAKRAEEERKAGVTTV